MEYDTIRSRGARISIRVDRLGNVTVRAPVTAPTEKIDAFVREKTPWIEKTRAKLLSDLAPYGDLLTRESALFEGRKIPIVYSGKRARLAESRAFLCVPENADAAETDRAILRVLGKQAAERLARRTEFWSKQTGLTPNRIGIAKFRTRWGTCDRNGNLKFNWRLVMLRDELVDYVVVHELAHLRFLDHSKDFWKLVARFLPDYAARRKALSSFGFLNDIYR